MKPNPFKIFLLEKTRFIFLLFCLLVGNQTLYAQDPDSLDAVVEDGGGLVFDDDEYTDDEDEMDKKMIVGIMVDPPFIIKDTDGSYYGLSIDLWNFIVDELDLKYEFQEFNDETAMLRKLNFNELDISINPTQVNSNRVKMYGATQPFFISSLGIATSSIPQNQFQMFISNIFSFDFLKIILGLMLIIVLFGSVVWYVESRKNNIEFGGGARGLLDGIWWAAVTMTTVGYGDKTPRSITGRLISIVWMFSGIITISSLTASITSQLTVNTLGMDIERLEDLKKVNRIGTVQYSPSEEYLMDHSIKPSKKYKNPVSGLEALSDGEVDVFVYDKPIMNYLITKNELENRVRVMPITFNRNYCSFMLPLESKLVNQINPILLDKISIASWANTLEKYNLDQGE